MMIEMPSHATLKEAFRQGEDAVVALFDEFGGQLTELAQQLQKQDAIIQELQAKLSKNSRNSSKPPSSDGYAKKKRTESLRPKGANPNGGQPGHKGETLRQTGQPDKVETHDKDCCKNCQAALSDVNVSDTEERQVFDIPAMKIVVTAHRATVKVCPACQTENKGDFPDSVGQPVQYGDGIKTVASYFSNAHFIPVSRTRQIIRDLYGQAPSEAVILSASQQLSEHIQPARDAIKQQLHEAPLLHSDETGLRVEGKLHWLHSASTEKLTDYEVHKKRGKEGMDATGILDGYQGRLVHDHWKTYFSYDDCEHIACNAHHLRELIYIEKQYQQPWAGAIATLLVEIKNTVDEARRAESTHLPTQQRVAFEKRYDEWVQQGLEKNPFVTPEIVAGQAKKRGRPKQTPAHNLLVRLRDFKTGTLAFMHDFSIPFDNNLAERDIRMVKVKQKVSGGFRTQEGAKQFAAIRGYISTARKNSVSVFGAISNAFTGCPFIPAPEP
jgi:transposase